MEAGVVMAAGATHLFKARKVIVRRLTQLLKARVVNDFRFRPTYLFKARVVIGRWPTHLLKARTDGF
jgi:hypothetical protein